MNYLLEFYHYRR